MMLRKNDCIGFLDEAVHLISTMREILDEPMEEAPQAFLEAYMDAQRQLSNALHAALVPALGGEPPNQPEHDSWIPGGDWTPNEATIAAMRELEDGGGETVTIEQLREEIRAAQNAGD
jgi:hypothetical protein